MEVLRINRYSIAQQKRSLMRMNMATTPAAKRHILVTSALPYANGPLHLGHILEVIQCDIWVRFQRLIGNTCHYVCGSDAHGTPIMLQAEKQGVSAEAMVQECHDAQKAIYQDFHISLDEFYTTHSEENKTLSSLIFERLKARGDISEKTIKQFYDPVKNIFLPDRYVKGGCPRCKADDQYGDSCEKCGATYSPTELINPLSALSNTTPIQKETDHFFFDLENYEGLLKTLTTQEHLQTQISHKLKEWFDMGLRPWDITRDGPYFGFEIPNAPNKYFYVWMDAPVGYMASFQHWCETQPNVTFEDYWKPDSPYELIHFIGKDIVYFHALFWPAMLHGSGFRTPSAIFAHGFLTINGEKMSKSRGTFITGKQYLEHLNPEYLRYYFAAKLNDGIDDLDFSYDDFVARVNSDLVGKFVNIASRTASFITKHFDGKLSDSLMDTRLYQDFVIAGQSIEKHLETRQFAKAVREIMALSDRANQFIAEQKPWSLAKDPEQLPQVQLICTQGINLFRVLAIYLKPILPKVAEAIEDFLQLKPQSWHDRATPLLGTTIKAYQPLIQRVDLKVFEKFKEGNPIMSENPTEVAKEPETAAPVDSKYDPIAPEITFDDFAKLDLRIAKIEHAEHVEGADKLLKLILDIGTEKRQVFAGIKSAFAPEDLIGKMTIMVANLAPRKMRFGMSEGMVMVASFEKGGLYLLEPQSGAEPGMRVK